MADSCQFFEHDNIANFFQSDRFAFVCFYRTETIFFSRKCLRTLRKEKLQIVKEKMKQRRFFFCQRIVYCFAQLHIVSYFLMV